MMRQALVALGPKSVVAGVLVGGAALALGALFLPRAIAAPAATGMYRLVLHAPEESGAFYISAWTEGDVFVASTGQKTITFVRRPWIFCEARCEPGRPYCADHAKLRPVPVQAT